MKSERMIFETIRTAAEIATYPIRKTVGIVYEANRETLENIIAERAYPLLGKFITLT